MYKFKVGDKVRIVVAGKNGYNISSNDYLNEVFVIKEFGHPSWNRPSQGYRTFHAKLGYVLDIPEVWLQKESKMLTAKEAFGIK